ncbi:MAG: VOC family protein [Acidimicrobiales bacterium]
MPTRQSPAIGSPCWVDLWTSDVEGSRSFYGELFGWEAKEPAAEFGGYFMFARDGVDIAGGMGDMGDAPADNTWRVYLTSDNATKTAEAATAEGAQVVLPPMPVADLGVQSVLVDPTGATVGIWEPRAFPGFTVMNEHAAPGWFELHTRDHARAVAFYRSVFRWDTNVVGDSDEFRYTTMRDPEGSGELAGIMDSSGFLPEGVPPSWAVYFEVDDADAAVAKVKALGGSVVMDAEDTPYGRLATVKDPAGAEFRLRRPNA